MKKISPFLIVLILVFTASGLKHMPLSRSASKKTGLPAITNISRPALLQSGSCLHKQALGTSSQNTFPKPTEIVQNERDEEAEKNAREEWLNNMHRVAPGQNWKVIDEKTRYEKALSRPGTLNKTVESFDSGKLKGYWIEKGSNNQAGRIVLTEVDTVNDYIYAASAGGNIWRGSSAGLNWECLNNNFKFNGICMLRILQTDTGQRILVATNANTFYFSDNYGFSWIKASGLENAEKWGSGTKAVMVNDSTHTIFFLLQEWDYIKWNSVVSLYYSTNNGHNFNKLNSYKDSNYYGTDRSDIWTDYYGSGKLYFLKDSVLFSLAPKSSTLNFVSAIKWKTKGSENLAGAEKGGKTFLYAMIDSTIYYSTNSGNSWAQKGYLNQNRYTKWSFHCSGENPNVIHIGNVNCWSSKNNGRIWALVNQWYDYYPSPKDKLHADIQSIQSFRSANNKFYTLIGNDGGLYKGDDGITTVTNLGLSGLQVSQYYSTYTNHANTGIINVGSQDQGFQRALRDSTGPVNFDQVVSGDYGHLCSSDGGASLWMVYPSFADFYPDAVTSKKEHAWFWTGLNTAPLWMAPIIADPLSPTKAYLGGGSSTSGSHIFHLSFSTKDSTVSAIEDTFDFSRNKLGKISALAISALNTNTRFVMTENGGLFYSYDAGTSWTLNKSITTPGPQYFYGACIFTSLKKSGRLWIGGSGYSNPGVYFSDDSGKTFKAVNSGLPSTLITGLAADSSEKFLFAATGVGPYVLNIAENKWYDFSGASAPDQIYWSVEYLPSLNTIRFGTYGRGIWDFKITDSMLSGIATTAGVQKAGLKIFPDPIVNDLHFEYDVVSWGSVSVKIFDMNGKLLLQKFYNSGNDRLSDEIDLTGLARGVYIFKLNSATIEETRKFQVQ